MNMLERKNESNKNKLIENSDRIINVLSRSMLWGKIFDNKNPIFCEIGIGDGHVLSIIAKRYPDINWVGFEPKASLEQPLINKEIKKLLQNENVRLVPKDIKIGINIFNDNQINEFYIIFPNSFIELSGRFFNYIDKNIWQKNGSLTGNLYKKLKPGGKLVIITESKKYAGELIKKRLACVFKNNNIFFKIISNNNELFQKIGVYIPFKEAAFYKSMKPRSVYYICAIKDNTANDNKIPIDLMSK